MHLLDSLLSNRANSSWSRFTSWTKASRYSARRIRDSLFQPRKAARAAATAPSTSCNPDRGKTPRSSPILAGFLSSKVSRPHQPPAVDVVLSFGDCRQHFRPLPCNDFDCHSLRPTDFPLTGIVPDGKGFRQNSDMHHKYPQQKGLRNAYSSEPNHEVVNCVTRSDGGAMAPENPEDRSLRRQGGVGIERC